MSFIVLLENGQLFQRTHARSSERLPDTSFIGRPSRGRNFSQTFLAPGRRSVKTVAGMSKGKIPPRCLRR